MNLHLYTLYRIVASFSPFFFGTPYTELLLAFHPFFGTPYTELLLAFYLFFATPYTELLLAFYPFLVHPIQNCC